MQEERLSAYHSKKRRRLLSPIPTIILLVCLLAIATFFGVAYFQSMNHIHRLKQTAAQTPDQETNNLIDKIGAHMVLPSEKPTIATVEDTKKLTAQPFFKNARKGDKVLMYTASKKAILYRPSVDKVIEVAYLNVKEGK